MDHFVSDPLNFKLSEYSFGVLSCDSYVAGIETSADGPNWGRLKNLLGSEALSEFSSIFAGCTNQLDKVKCDHYKEGNYCEDYKSFMVANCPDTCGYCDGKIFPYAPFFIAPQFLGPITEI